MRYPILLLIWFILIPAFVYPQTLEEYYRIALENNPGIRAKYLDYQAALKKISQAKGLPDPALGAGYYLSKPETKMGIQRYKLTLTQMFPWFGTLKAQGDEAALQAEAKYYEFIDASNRLFIQLSEAWYSILEVREWIRLEEENVRLLKAYQSIALTRYENGSGSMVNLLRIDLMLRDAETNLQIYQDMEKPRLTAFNTILNRPDTEPVITPGGWGEEPKAVKFSKDSLVRHPALKATEKLQMSFRKRESVAFRKGLPSFGLGLEYMVNDPIPGLQMPDNGKDGIMPMITITLPVYRGKYTAMKEEARLMQKRTEEQKHQVENQLRAEFDQAWLEYSRELQLIQLYDDKINVAEQALNLLFTEYANSGRDFEEVLRMQQELLDYRKKKASALKNYHIAEAKLMYLTKGEISHVDHQ